jgi:hypothetical protein
VARRQANSAAVQDGEEKESAIVRKIPTLFERDWDGDRSRVVNKVHPDCQWVLDGDGIATQKLDGACCMIRDSILYKRREIKKGDVVPNDFEPVMEDPETGKTVGWVRVGDGPEDRWFREALNKEDGCAEDGTYELLGPKVQGNPEKLPDHILWAHTHAPRLTDVPRDFEGLRQWLYGKPMEGIVFHHTDGRMAKIKLRDFGLKR